MNMYEYVSLIKVIVSIELDIDKIIVAAKSLFAILT